jgi:UDP-glucose 4-epimerase
MPVWTPAPQAKPDFPTTRWVGRLLQPDGIFQLLTHLTPTPKLPERTVVIGAGGFVGGAIVTRLKQQGANVLSVTRHDVDLLATDAAATLKALLQPEDAVVAAAARAPCKDMLMLIDNMVMTKAMLDAITAVSVLHVINISSDSVYPDEPLPLTEKTPAAPSTFHGVMHLAREIAFSSEVKAPFAILRPSLIYGADDPHNGYGPNRFRRQANAGENIALFGDGEERRDHVLIDDVADLVVRVLARRSRGILNIATGTVHTFRAIAEKAVDLATRKVSISGRPRQGSMPHNGYRPFDIAALRAAFPDFTYTPLFEGMAKAQRAMTVE